MEDDLKQAIEKISKLSEENNAMLKKINRHFLWQKIISVIYFILIVGPLIAGIFFLPPLLKDAFSQYQELLGLPAGGTMDLNSIMKNINPETIKNVKQ